MNLGPIINPEDFVGRKQCLDIFEKNLHNNFLVLGEDGIGKTSFLNFLEEYCRQHNIVTCRMKVFEKESVQSFAKRFYETVDPLIPLEKSPKKRFSIIGYFTENAIWWWNYFKDYFKSFLKIGRYIKKEAEGEALQVPSFREYLDNVNEKLDQKVILFIDDIHLMESKVHTISIMKNMLWTSYNKIKYVLCINNKSLSPSQKEKFSSYSRNKPMQYIELSPFSEEEARAYIIRRFKRRNIEITEEGMQRIFSLTGYHPYYMNLLCYLIFKEKKEGSKIDELYLNEKFAQVKNRSQYNEYLYNLLDENKKKIVEKIALSSRTLSLNVLKEFPDIQLEESKLEELINNLKDEGYLREEDNSLVMFHSLFTNYVRNREKGEEIEPSFIEEISLKEEEEEKEELYLEEEIKEELEEEKEEKKPLKKKVDLIPKRRKERRREEKEIKDIEKIEGRKAEILHLTNRIVDYYQKAISKTKDIYWKSIYCIEIADCLKGIGRLKEAANYLLKASEITDNDDEKSKLILQAREYLLEIGERDESNSLLEKALKIYLDAYNKTTETYWKAKYQWKAAECLLLLNRREEAENLSREAISYFIESAKTTNDYYWKANYYKQSAECLKKLGRVEDYQKMSQTIKEHYYRAIESVSGDYWKAKYIHDLAEFLENNGQIDESKKLYQEAANFYLLASKAANDPIRKVEDLQLSSKCLIKINKAKEAEDVCEKIAKHYLNTIRDIEDPETRAKSLRNIGDSYKSIGKTSEALGYYIDASKAVVEAEEEARYLSLAVDCLIELKRFKDAEKIAREAIKDFKKASNKTSDIYWKAKYLKNAQEILLNIEKSKG
jgi:tetratricopeptide (TPR) repeat protein